MKIINKRSEDADPVTGVMSPSQSLSEADLAGYTADGCSGEFMMAIGRNFPYKRFLIRI